MVSALTVLPLPGVKEKVTTRQLIERSLKYPDRPTNIRAADSDENILLRPPRQFPLETVLEYVQEDEPVESMPTHIRLRKMLLEETDRRRDNRRQCRPGVQPMPINADKPHLWKQDIQKSVDMFNDRFMEIAPLAYREIRAETTREVEEALQITRNFSVITAQILREHPKILPTLRMATCPPLARDRLIGLANVSKNLVNRMEKQKDLPPRMSGEERDRQLGQLANVLQRLLDEDISP